VQSEESRPVHLPLLVAILLGLISVFHLGNAWRGQSFNRALHFGTALEYARGPINLFQPTIVGFNATGTPTAQELPVWQAAAGFVFKAFRSEWPGWANLVSLCFFASSLWPFFQLARHHIGERAAWWSLAFFLAQPLIVVWSGMASTDSFSLVVSIWFLFFADRMIRTGKFSWWFPTALFAAWTAVSKLPFFVNAGLCSAFLLIGHSPRDLRRWVLLTGAGLVATASFLAWNHHTNSLSALAIYPYEELRLSINPNQFHWYFGDLQTRLDPGIWIKGGWRFLHATLGTLPLTALLALALLHSGNRMPKLWLLAMVPTVFLFTPVILGHWHYFLMGCPAVAMLCGATLSRWEGFLTQELRSPRLRFAVVTLALICSAVDGVIVMKVSSQYDSFKKNLAVIIREKTNPEDRLIVFDHDDWGGEILTASQRKGLCVCNLETRPGVSKGLFELLHNQADMDFLKSLGYNKLVLLSESPVRYAVEAVNPNSTRTRRLYPKSISPTVDAWPVIYSSEDLLIKSIPGVDPSAASAP
jgi:Dolichyl-phosphate-mannose-protein mannosyltransferase